MTEQELIERLADAEHASWARWQAYLHSKCLHHPLGKLIPEASVDHWQRQIETPYVELTEREKQSDRDEVAHILPAIREYTEAALIGFIGDIFDSIEQELERRGDPVTLMSYREHRLAYLEKLAEWSVPLFDTDGTQATDAAVDADQ